MEQLDDIYITFIEKFKIVLLYIDKHFGSNDILLKKNQGLIKDRDLGISNSPIKGYIFHGFGCEFRFKSAIVDVEFYGDAIGFTEWSFYSYSRKVNDQINENEISVYLKEKVNSKQLIYNGRFFVLPRCSLSC